MIIGITYNCLIHDDCRLQLVIYEYIYHITACVIKNWIQLIKLTYFHIYILNQWNLPDVKQPIYGTTNIQLTTSHNICIIGLHYNGRISLVTTPIHVFLSKHRIARRKIPLYFSKCEITIKLICLSSSFYKKI